MGVNNLSAGENLPNDINVVIEIASHTSPIKYELDKSCGMIRVDRFLGTSMAYPCEYGFIPKTLAEDGDPVDVLVISPFSLQPGVIIRCRPIGLLQMTDEAGNDAKILAVPIAKLTPDYNHIQTPEDLNPQYLQKIEHFFTHYKDLEKGKWVKVKGWANLEAAILEINQGVERYKK